MEGTHGSKVTPIPPVYFSLQELCELADGFIHRDDKKRFLERILEKFQRMREVEEENKEVRPVKGGSTGGDTQGWLV